MRSARFELAASASAGQLGHNGTRRPRTRSTMRVSGVLGRASPHGCVSRFRGVWATSGPRACRRFRQRASSAIGLYRLSPHTRSAICAQLSPSACSRRASARTVGVCPGAMLERVALGAHERGGGILERRRRPGRLSLHCTRPLVIENSVPSTANPEPVLELGGGGGDLDVQRPPAWRVDEPRAHRRRGTPETQAEPGRPLGLYALQ